MRILVVLVALTALAAPSAAWSRGTDRTVDRGIVQSVSPDRIVIRTLDGTERAVAIDSETRIVLNGAETPLAAIRPGFVAEIVSDSLGEARVVRAFGRTAPAVARGTVLEVSKARLLLRQPGGQTVEVALTQRTRVRLGRVPVRFRVLRTGLDVEVILTSDGTARVIVVRRGQRLR